MTQEQEEVLKLVKKELHEKTKHETFNLVKGLGEVALAIIYNDASQMQITNYIGCADTGLYSYNKNEKKIIEYLKQNNLLKGGQND